MKRMLISVDREESRAAVVEDNRLVHLEIEPVHRDSVKGNIYRGVVARVEPSLQSAFVDFGRDKQGFLPVGDIHPKLRGDNTDKRAAIQDLIKSGQELLVQVTKDEIGNKGATLTTFISLPGRYLVLMPESEKTGVSRKLGDSARERVKELTENMKVPDGFGLIVRTAGESATKLELTKDLAYLNRLWEHIDKGFSTGKGPTTLYHERSLAIRFVRDYFRKDISEIVVDDPDTLGEVMAYLKVLMPRSVSVVERYSGVIPLFARYGIAGQVEDVFSRQVPLPSGGSIVIDQTEALVAVDVNSGRVKGKDIEETARQTNIEAAQQVARQLVLRDLGGLVVIDFIDMRDKKSVREVEAALKSAMKSDKARHKLGRISEFGLMELSRQRLKSSVNKGVFESCAHCSGTGFYRTNESVAASIMRRIHELVAAGDVAYLVATMPPEAANYLLNARRAELAAVEQAYHVSIEIVGVEGMTAAQVTVEHLQRIPHKSGAEQIREARFKRVTRRMDLVRNKLLHREEARIERRLSVDYSGAAVDYANVYTGVLDDTADVAEEARRSERRKPAPKAGARRRSKAAPVEAQVVEPPPEPLTAPEPPARTGFGAWLKGLFGMGGPTPADTAIANLVHEPEAQAGAQAIAAEEEHATPSDDEPKRGRRSNRRRGGRGAQGSVDADGAGEPSNETASAASTGTHQEESAQDDSEDVDGRRRRRRRRRRGGRGRRRDEEVAEGSEAEDVAADGHQVEGEPMAEAAATQGSAPQLEVPSTPTESSKADRTKQSGNDLVDISELVQGRLLALGLSADLSPGGEITSGGDAATTNTASKEVGDNAASDAISAQAESTSESEEPADSTDETGADAAASISGQRDASADNAEAAASDSEESAVAVVDEATEPPVRPSYKAVIDLRAGANGSSHP